MSTALVAVVVGRERSLARGVCALCEREVALTKGRRCRAHVAPDGTLHVDEPAIGVTPLRPRRRTTCAWCSGDLTPAQVAKGQEDCSKACAFARRLAIDPELPKRASAKGQVVRRRQYAGRLAARLAPSVRQVLALAEAGTLTFNTVLPVFAEQHRRSYKAGHTVGATTRRRAARAASAA